LQPAATGHGHPFVPRGSEGKFFGSEQKPLLFFVCLIRLAISSPPVLALPAFNLQVVFFPINCSNAETLFQMLQAFPILRVTIGLPWTFTMFAGMCTIAWFFVFYCMPETKGYTLEEIARKMAGKPSEEDRRKARSKHAVQ
jgi:hypothetical protein